ncbi:hypothetical protein BKA56DRAFT_619475 [Ilyonectria sp. MPI-CAGE-AT-0026]|nr:hypothetical protein BKA56DRAFT_619475 [Ilyonectria sp. MPI-CAGE-AT-0026]
MIALKQTLLLLGAASSALAFPAAADGLIYDINGHVQAASANKRAIPYPVCDDAEYRALTSNQAEASPFCSTYLRSTVTATVIPDIQQTTTTTTTDFITVQGTSTATGRGLCKPRRSTTVTITDTVQATDIVTEAITDTASVGVTPTATAQVTDTVTEEITNSVTEQVTDTVTVLLTDTATQEITNTVTDEVTSQVAVTVTSTSTAAAPTVTTANDVHCALNGYGTSAYSVGSTTNFGNNFAGCKSYCSNIASAISFGFGSNQCACYNQPAIVNRRAASSVYYFYDIACLSGSAPAKRDVKRAVQVPDYLPNDDPSAVSSACSCLITTPAAPTTTYFIASVITVTDTTTSTITQPANVVYKTVTVTNHNTATVTRPVTITITHYNTVTITNHNTVTVTDYNTAYFTNTNTTPVTDIDTITATVTDFATITNYNTVTGTITKFVTVTPATVTVTRAPQTVYGS